MLWISLHLPQLPLEALVRGAPTPEPVAIVEAQRILVCDARAWHRGVRPGMKLAAATALVPQLRPLARDPAAETEALLGLASWASQFTPSVALEFPSTPNPTFLLAGGRSSGARAGSVGARPLLPPHCAAALLLEVEGSLKLFGSIERIAGQLRQGAEAMGFDAYVASAPTARAATWLARTGETTHIAANDDLAARLAPLPLVVTGCDMETLASLGAIGANTVGDLLALPREGLARRFGQSLLDRLDQALGRTADPRNFYVPPPTFRARIDFVAEVTQAEALLFAAHRLLVQLEGYLVARAAAVPRFSLAIAHRGAGAIASTGDELRTLESYPAAGNPTTPRPPSAVRMPASQGTRPKPTRPGAPSPEDAGAMPSPDAAMHAAPIDAAPPALTTIDVGLVAPSRDAGHLTAILRERLGRTALVEPARSITLAAETIVPFAAGNASLFRDAAPAAEDWARLVERLRARLGHDAVHGLATAADHRPERAWRRAELVATRASMTRASRAGRQAREGRDAAAGAGSDAGVTTAAARLGRRPFWLLAAPRRLEQVAEKPHCGGPLAFLAGPERIEAGWWDGAPCARDYFVARTPDDALLWVYRETSGWFVHGMFG
jgi:protein ImuB